MVDVVLYEPKLTTLKVGIPITAPTTASSVYTQITDTVTGGVTKWLKDVTISGINRGVDKQDFIGKDASGFQNQELEKKPIDAVKISGTMAMSPVDTDASMGAILTGATGVVVGSGKRYQYHTILARAYGLQFTDGTKIISLALNNAEITKIGDYTQSSDSHAELKFEAVCLIRDFYDFDDDGA